MKDYMDHEIEKLKQEYLNTPVPQFLVDKGFDDVMVRIQTQPKKLFVSSRLVAIVSVLTVMIVVFTGLTVASSPDTTLYGIKAAVQDAIHLVNPPFLHPSPIPVVEKKVIKVKRVKPSVTPTVTPSPTSNPSNNSNSSKQPNVQNMRRNPSPTKTDVKGVSTQAVSEQIRGNSEEHRNVNSQQDNGNGQEKSNSKKITK